MFFIQKIRVFFKDLLSQLSSREESNHTQITFQMGDKAREHLELLRNRLDLPLNQVVIRAFATLDLLTEDDITKIVIHYEDGSEETFDPLGLKSKEGEECEEDDDSETT